MKRRFVAILMAGGLVLGLCGCGSSGDSTAASVPTEEVAATPTDTVETEKPTASTEFIGSESLPDYFAESESEPEDAMPAEDLESTSPEAVEPETALGAESSTIGIDMSALLTAHVIEYEDQDVYKIRETCQLSPIFRESDSETMYALWEALGNDVADFPSEESLYGASYMLRDARNRLSLNNLEYIVGTYSIENLTDGFPITSDSPRSYNRALKAIGNGDIATAFNNSSVSMVVYSSRTEYYGENYAVAVGSAKMESDTWGPRTFVIALPNGYTPNRPDGHRYDEIEIEFGNKAYADSGYDVFELNYFGEGGN